MIERNRGHLVYVTSAAGLFGTSGLADYCASKFAVVGLAESVLLELTALDKTGVHVCEIAPYFINTGMFDGVVSKYSLNSCNYFVASIFTTNSFLQQKVEYLLSPYVYGSVLAGKIDLFFL